MPTARYGADAVPGFLAPLVLHSCLVLQIREGNLQQLEAALAARASAAQALEQDVQELSAQLSASCSRSEVRCWPRHALTAVVFANCIALTLLRPECGGRSVTVEGAIAGVQRARAGS